MQIIDAYTHILPARYVERIVNEGTDYARAEVERMTGKFPALVDLEERWRILETVADEEYSQILTLGAPDPAAIGSPDLSAELARLGNEEMAGLVDSHPDRFAGFAAGLPLNDVGAGVRELHRAVGELGALGCQIYSNVEGVPLDAPQFRQVFEAADELECAVWLHPMRNRKSADYPLVEDESKQGIFWSLGWPYETSVAMARLAYDGVFDRHPTLKVITHHGGAMIPQVFPRVELLVFPEQRPVFDALERPVADYLRMFNGDTVLATPEAVRSVMSFFGADNVLFGTDMPYPPPTVDGVIEIVRAAGLPESDLAKVFAGNAEALLEGGAKRR